MKYAFIDYENIHSLDSLDLKEYERIFLFLGANQQSIQLSQKFNDELNITLITVKDIAKNNLDFHIAYYLGKMDIQTDKNIEFCVISKDNGYLGICDFIQNQQNARKCLLNKPQGKSEDVKLLEDKSSNQLNIELYLEEFRSYIAKAQTNHLPTKKDKLCNAIRSQTGIKKLDEKLRGTVVNQVIESLKKEKLINLNDETVSYPSTKEESPYFEYEKYLLQRSKTRRPTLLKSLKNDIKSKCNVKDDITQVNSIIKKLKENKIIQNSSNEKITYLK